MGKRYFRACATVSAAGLTAALSLGATSASAAVAGHRMHRDTPQCQAYNGGGSVHCVTWAQDVGNGPLGLRIAATGGFVNAPVTMQQADSSDPMQDFLVTNLGLVSTYFNGGANDLGLNAYDNTNYGNDMLVSVEFAPGGVPTDLCLGNKNNNLQLRQCNGLRWQTFIEATSVQYTCASIFGDLLTGPGGQAPLSINIPTGNVGTQTGLGTAGSLADAPTGYDCDDSDFAAGTSVPITNVGVMLLSVARVFDNGQHRALTGSNIDGAQATFTHPWQNNREFWIPVV
jgi:hypothetical protein